ncbi:hypothetical protein OSL50_26665, partial [Escherichia coli]|nr:hypothetical protein [Escherichia coli]
GDELSISWREVEPGCDIFYTHDENDFFPEECYVTAYGELFEDCEGAYSTFGDLVIQNTLTGAGFEPLSFFSFLPVGIVCVIVGTLVLM